MRPTRLGSAVQGEQDGRLDTLASSDVEKGLRRPSVPGDDGYRDSMQSDDVGQGGSGANTPRRKEHGKGLTEGDQGESPVKCCRVAELQRWMLYLITICYWSCQRTSFHLDVAILTARIGLVLFLAALDMSASSTPSGRRARG